MRFCGAKERGVIGLTVPRVWVGKLISPDFFLAKMVVNAGRECRALGIVNKQL